MTNFTLVQFTLITKRGRVVIKTEPCWIASCSFADGPGMKVKKMTTTRDLAKAARFSLASAHAIAAQFFTKPASLVDETGAIKIAETATLYAEQLQRLANRAQVRAEFDQALRDLFPADLYARLRAAVTR